MIQSFIRIYNHLDADITFVTLSHFDEGLRLSKQTWRPTLSNAFFLKGYIIRVYIELPGIGGPCLVGLS